MRKMMPIGPLMIEHRLIEKMIGVIDAGLPGIEREAVIKAGFVETMVDFIRTYADRCHHGNEEGILFRELKKKKISHEHRHIMNELIEEHAWGRKTTASLADAYGRYREGEKDAVREIVARLRSLTEFYPKHIEKEDRRFFRPVMDYFSQEERDAMLREGWEFDQKLIHEKYRGAVEEARAVYQG